MSRDHWVMALVALLLWVASPMLFFKRDIERLWKTRVERRMKAEQAARQKREAEDRARDELATKYGVPSSHQSPGSPG